MDVSHGQAFWKGRPESGIFRCAFSSAFRDDKKVANRAGMPRFTPESASGLSVRGHMREGGSAGLTPDFAYSTQRFIEEEAAVSQRIEDRARPRTVAHEPRTTAPLAPRLSHHNKHGLSEATHRAIQTRGIPHASSNSKIPAESRNQAGKCDLHTWRDPFIITSADTCPAPHASEYTSTGRAILFGGERTGESRIAAIHQWRASVSSFASGWMRPVTFEYCLGEMGWGDALPTFPKRSDWE